MKTLSTSLVALLLASACLQAESVKDREGAVRNDRAKLEQDERWNYNNVEKALEEGRAKGKPVMLVLRCVPCLACMGLDTGVLMSNDGLDTLLDKFVCVRLINCNALDLARFQFDYDLSFSVLFLNGDGTTYGRYGSWKHQKNSQESATQGLRKAMDAALAVHGGYPGNKEALKVKQPAPSPFKTPVEIPQLAERYKPQLDWEGKVAQSCVHCHMIGSALQAYHRKQKQPLPEELIFPFPEPETVGLTLASEEVATVTAVAAGSAAAQAGLQVGDAITEISGAPVLSIADLSWALHRSPSAGQLQVKVQRGGQQLPLSVQLAAGWRTKSQVTLRAAIWPERGMALGGLRVEPSDTPGLGLSVTHVGQYGIHATAKKHGFKPGDVLLEFGEITTRMTEGELLGRLLTTKMMGDVVPVKIQRGAETHTLKLPMQ